MSYSGQNALGAAPSVDVGRRATRDPILATASLDAAKIMTTMAQSPAERRLVVMNRELDKLGQGLATAAGREMKAAMERGVSADQAAFDGMRMAIANRRMDRKMDEVRHMFAQQHGWDALLDTGLGDIAPNDRQAGCVAAATGSTVGGALQVIPVYGTIIGGVLGIGGAIAGQALDCSRETREAQQRAAQAQATAAAAELQRAQTLAAAQSASGRRRSQAMVIGGGVLLTILTAVWLLK